MKKFTLIELLIVIAIIGILASLLLPSLHKARDKAKQAVCLNNQKQVYVATLSYITENDSYAPYDNHWSQAQENWKNKTWYNRLIPDYLPEGTKVVDGPSDVQFCPSGRDKLFKWDSTIAMNSVMNGKADQNWANRKPEKILKATPEETMIFMDSYAATRGAWFQHMTSEKLLDSDLKDRIARHLEKANVTYLDGHARARSYNYFLTLGDRDLTFWDPKK